jgi:predicted PurR-regulated permease PerM
MRLVAILLVYLAILIIIVLAMIYLVTLIVRTMGTLTQDSQQIIPKAVDAVAKALKSLPFLSDQSIQAKIDTYAAQIEAEAPGMLSNFLSGSVKTMQSALGTVFSFIITPIFMVFILKDWERLRRDVYIMLPHWAREHTKNIFSILQEVLLAYIRSALLQAMWVGICYFILLMVLKVPFALPLAVFGAMFEVVPSFGPLIAGALAAIVTLVMGDPQKILWVLLGYGAIQMFENNILVPRIQSSQMQIHPAFILLISIIGAHFAGLAGFIIALPLTLTVSKMVSYFWESSREGYIT